MLIELNVTNFAIIHHLQMQFDEGLNIISGETGAGKSVIVRALNLLMGAKSFAEDIREGAEQATVEGFFELQGRKDLMARIQSAGIDCSEKTLTVRRVISHDGKNRVYLNGHLSSLADLKLIVCPLVEVTGKIIPLMEITGQHDNKSLMSPQFHLDLVDQFCETLDLRSKVESLVQQKNELVQKRDHLLGTSKDRLQRVDFIRFQIREIENLELNENIDSQLEEKIKTLRAQSANSDFLISAQEALTGDTQSVSALLEAILKKGLQLKYKDTELSESLEQLVDIKTKIIDVAYAFSQMANGAEDSSEDLNALEERLSSLRKLEKKFGSTLQEILMAYENMKQELAELESSDETIKQWEKKIQSLELEIKPLCSTLSEKRRKGVQKLKKAVNDELADLNMNGVLLSVSMGELPEPSTTGQDIIQFMIQNGPKAEARPLHKTASGGELSRILLSLKIASGHIDVPRTYLFDEVDTGVSGPTAQKVGKKLKSIASGQQVICITHLPQVASFADQHYFISKMTQNGVIKMTAQKLENEKHIQEIARLISGENITKTSLAHAKQLVESSTL